MYELPSDILDVVTVLALEPEELGAKVLFLIRERIQRERNHLASWATISRSHSVTATMARRHIPMRHATTSTGIRGR